MKKISKLKIKEFHEMNEMEMKNVMGGYGPDPATPLKQNACRYKILGVPCSYTSDGGGSYTHGYCRQGPDLILICLS